MFLLKLLKGLVIEHYSGINASKIGFQTRLESARLQYYPDFPWIRNILRWKMSVLISSDIFRLFVNTLTSYNKYSRFNMQKFELQVQTALS